jgi:DNA-binding transcriptional LysR family regulator
VTSGNGDRRAYDASGHHIDLHDEGAVRFTIVMRLPPDGLLAFAAVIDEGGVGQAARALNLSQPAISNRMRALQAIVGAPLYERRGGRTLPTAIGARLLPHARAVAHALDRASTELADTQAPIRIAIAEAAAPLIGPRLALLAARHPEIELEVTHEMGTRIIDAVLASRIDIGITTAAPYGGGEHLDRAVVMIDEILLVQPANAMRPAAPTSLEDLATLTILWQARTSGVRLTVERALEAAGVEPYRSLELGSGPAALASAAAGVGCCFVNRSMAQPFLAAGLVEPVLHTLGGLYAHIEVVTQPADFMPPHHQRVRAALLPRQYHDPE